MNKIIQAIVKLLKQKCYIYNIDTGKLEFTIYVNDAPLVGENVIIYHKNKFKHFTVVKRIFGANANNNTSVWNLYVHPDKKES